MAVKMEMTQLRCDPKRGDKHYGIMCLCLLVIYSHMESSNSSYYFKKIFLLFLPPAQKREIFPLAFYC